MENSEKKSNKLLQKIIAILKPKKKLESAKKFGVYSYDSMKNDYHKGGFKGLIKNKIFISTCVIALIIMYLFSGGESGYSIAGISDENFKLASYTVYQQEENPFICKEEKKVFREGNLTKKELCDRYNSIIQKHKSTIKSADVKSFDGFDGVRDYGFDYILDNSLVSSLKDIKYKYRDNKDLCDDVSDLLEFIKNNRELYLLSGKITSRGYDGSEIKIKINDQTYEIYREKSISNSFKPKSFYQVNKDNHEYTIPLQFGYVKLIAHHYDWGIGGADYSNTFNFISYNGDFIDHITNPTENYIEELIQGKKDVESIIDASIKYNASSDKKYLSHPPLDGPSGNQWFRWTGTLVKKDGGTYVSWDAEINPFSQALNESYGYNRIDPIDTGGFAFKALKEKFSELQQDKETIVVGKYVDNMNIDLINGETKTIPVLSDCYVTQ